MRKLTVLLFAAVVAGCGYDDFDSVVPAADTVSLPCMTIAQLRQRCVAGAFVPQGTGIVVSGYVTTSDSTGNFFRSFFIEDNTGAAEIMAGRYDLYGTYPPGSRVSVRLDGLLAVVDEGVLKIGLGTAALSRPAYMDSRVVLDRHVSRWPERIVPAPFAVSPGAWSDGKTGCRVRVAGLRLDAVRDTTWAVPAALSPGGVPRSASLKFGTFRGDSIYVLTSGYASFAACTVPRTSVTLTGILLQGRQNGRTVYQLKMRDLNDVQTDSLPAVGGSGMELHIP